MLHEPTEASAGTGTANTIHTFSYSLPPPPPPQIFLLHPYPNHFLLRIPPYSPDLCQLPHADGNDGHWAALPCGSLLTIYVQRKSSLNFPQGTINTQKKQQHTHKHEHTHNQTHTHTCMHIHTHTHKQNNNMQ